MSKLGILFSKGIKNGELFLEFFEYEGGMGTVLGLAFFRGLILRCFFEEYGFCFRVFML